MNNQVKLKRIELCGFKSYGKNQSVTLNNVNVLIGANGSGKSNFVSFLEMISYLSSDGLATYTGKNGFAPSILYNGKGIDGRIKGTLTFSDGEKIDEYSLTLMAAAGGGLFIDEESIVYSTRRHEEPYKKKLYSMSGVRSGLFGLSQKNKTAGIILKLLQGCRIFHFNDTTVTSKFRSPGYVFDNAYLRSEAGNLAAILYKLKTTEKYKPHYDRIVRTIREVFACFDDFVFAPESNDGYDSNIRLDWKEKGNEAIFGPHMLSDGTIRFMALTALLLQPEEMLPGVIILDEPEIGLHPYAIRTLRRMIRMASKYSQLIIATQSVSLINEFDCEDVIIAEYNQNERSSIIRRLEKEQLKVWLEEYSLGELWEKNVLGGTPD